MTYGISTSTFGDSIHGRKMSFEPFQGLVNCDCDIIIETGGRDRPDIPCGTIFGVNDAKLLSNNPFTIKLLEESQLWIVSDFERNWQSSYCHLFAGAFEGWNRAVEWLQHRFGIGFAQSFSVDNDDDVMTVWSMRNDAPVFKPPFKITGGKYDRIFGILANVREHTWINKCLIPSNFWFSMSPPCISWSTGGRSAGLEHDAGMAFIFAIDKIIKVRPIGIIGECADATPKHPHCKILRALMTFAGYHIIWESVEPLHLLSPMMRNRWLFVWIRNDISCSVAPKVNLLKGQTMTSWNDEMYRFFIPDQISHQMKLGNKLLGIYGDPSMLPVVKRNCLPANPCRDDVLRARCPDPNQPLPTLCASYSSQHLLSVNHLQNKGIFAILSCDDQNFHFLDPFRFCALLGLPDSQIAVLPSKLSIAFRQIGNAIAVPHALKTLLVALTTVGSCNLPINETVIECWMQRIKGPSCLCSRNADFLFVLPDNIASVFLSKTVGQPQWIPRRTINENKVVAFFHRNESGWEIPYEISIENFLWKLGFENPKKQFASCSIEKADIPWSTIMSMCVGKSILIHMQNGDCLPFRVEIVIEPTQSWSQDDSLRKAVIDAETQSDQTDRIIVFRIAEDRPITSIMKRSCDDAFVSEHLESLCNPNKDFREPCWIECLQHPFKPDFQRCFIVDLHEKQRDIKYFLIIDQHGNGKAVFNHVLQPISVLLHNVGFDAVDFEWNAFQGISEHKLMIQDGDVVTLHPTLTPSKSEAEAKIASRIEFFNEHVEKAATDEFAFGIGLLTAKVEKCFFNPIIDLSVVSDAADILTHFHWALDNIDLSVVMQYDCFFPLLLNNHWCAIETSFDQKLTVNCIGIPDTLIHEFIDVFAWKVNIDKHLVRRQILPLVGMNGLCGWTVLKRWFQITKVYFPVVKSQISRWVFKAHFDDFLQKHKNDPGYNTFCSISDFAISIRVSFICHLRISLVDAISLEKTPKVGAALDDEKMTDVTAKPDPLPWLRYDPWASKEKSKQCKWEDLKLSPTHPFVGKDQKPVLQVHRQKLTPHAGGIAFTTKSQVQALLSLSPSEPAAILIPAVDASFFDTLQPKPKVSGPHEVIVCDALNGDTYKRQVWMIDLTAGISFLLPKPSYQAKLQDVCEIVFEVDSRLLPKELHQGFIDKPHDHFKTKILDQFSSIDFPRVNLYAFRKFTPKGADPSHVVYQIMCKVPSDKRKSILAQSGVGNIFIRDYIAKGEKLEDITVIPKFWEVTKQAKDEAVRATCGLQGFAGLMISKRGLAARAWTSDIATLRRALLPLDDRLTDLNLNVVPRIVRESTGWPSAISPQEIIRATHHALSAAPVPSRCFRSNGVTCWTLAFEKEPSETTFVAQFNDRVYEILLTVPGAKKSFKPNGGSAKSKKAIFEKQFEEPAIKTDDQIHDRVSMLEAKFTNLERRQDVVENKVTTGFDQVQDQLRQILNAVGGRDKSPTGSTPPPKFPKTA